MEATLTKIKVNELRVGNWLISERQIPQQVAYVGDTIGFHNEMGGTDKHQRNPIFSYNIEKIHPIPLTPRILEKSGFRLDEDAGNWKSPDMKIWRNRLLMIGEDNGKFYLYNQCEDDFYSWYHPEIKYVHRLQNLCYEHTDELLEVNL